MACCCAAMFGSATCPCLAGGARVVLLQSPTTTHRAPLPVSRADHASEKSVSAVEAFEPLAARRSARASLFPHLKQRPCASRPRFKRSHPMKTRLPHVHQTSPQRLDAAMPGFSTSFCGRECRSSHRLLRCTCR